MPPLPYFIMSGGGAEQKPWAFAGKLRYSEYLYQTPLPEGTPMKAASGMVVTMHYTLTNDGGDVLDSSRGGDPLTYLHGHGNIVSGLEKALEGAAISHQSRVTVAAAEGYGERNEELMFEAERTQFPPDMALAIGERVYAEGQNGPVSFTVVELTEKGAILDGNHPLAGQTLYFEVEIVAIRPATDEEIAHGHVHGPHGHDH